MSKFTLEVDIKEFIGELPIERRIELVRELEKETWAKRLEDVVNKIHSQIKRIPSQKEIDNTCKRARRRVYEKYKSSH